jgi:hypothetical protein
MPQFGCRAAMVTCISSPKRSCRIDQDGRRSLLPGSKRFLDEYYSTDFLEERLKLWTAYGAPDECVGRMHEFAAAGVQTMVLRFISYDRSAQLRRFIAEVARSVILPASAAASTAVLRRARVTGPLRRRGT